MIEQFNILLELQKIDNDLNEEAKKKEELPSRIEKIIQEIQESKNNLKNNHNFFINPSIFS